MSQIAAEPGVGTLSVGSIVCAYTEARWTELSAAVVELESQVQPGDQLIVVIDHNDALLARARNAFTGPQTQVVPNAYTRGLSGARNTGIENCHTDITVFLDDDAFPEPGWMQAYRRRFSESAQIVGAGGAIVPNWEGGQAPKWFPDEYGWVVGCDYRGLPGDGEQIRNPIGASMAVRADVYSRVGEFNDGVGRVGALPVGCEETEFFIRVKQDQPDALVVRDTEAVVHHLVPRSRQTVKYFFSRCYHEGRSKAAVTAVVGAGDGLSAERSYVIKTLVRGMGLHSKQALHGDLSGLARAAMLPAGLAATTYGYVRGMLHFKKRQG